MERPNDNNASRALGFTLIEIVVVLLIFAIVVAMAAAVTRGVLAAQKRSVTTTRMQTVDAAVVQFVMQQKRLPCPANGALPSTDNNAGLEVRGPSACTGNQQGGVVPWRTLGLSEADATDGWDRRITYRLDPQLGNDNGLDMSWCDPAGTEGGATPRAQCNTACTSATLGSCTKPVDFVRGRGLIVKNIAGTVVMDPAPSPSTTPPTGAAYVAISPGETGGGGYLFGSGGLSASGTSDGTEELKNYASLAFTSTTVTYYVDDAPNTGTTTHFDDVVLHPSILNVVSRAALGPRAH